MLDDIVAFWTNASDPFQILILLGICVGFGIIAARLIQLSLIYWQKKRFELVPGKGTGWITRPLYLLIPTIIFLFSQNTFFQNGFAEHSGKFVLILFYIGIAWLSFRLVQAVEAWFLRRYDITVDDNIHQRKIITQIQFIKRLVIIGISILMVSAILLSFENVRELGATILTSAGVFGILVGFAAQKSIANLLAGFQIAFTQPIKIDDALIIENDFGRVEEITLTYVVIRTWDSRRLVIPLNYFIEKPFQNWTKTSSSMLGVIFLYTDFHMPLDFLREKLMDILKDHPMWNREVAKVQVVETLERAMKIRVLIGAYSSKDLYDFRCEVREQLIDFIREKYPQYLPTTRLELQGKDVLAIPAP